MTRVKRTLYKRIVFVIIIIIMSLLLVGCGGGAFEMRGIGISLPKSEDHFKLGDFIWGELSKNYAIELNYHDDVAMQANYVEKLLADFDVIIIEPIDGDALKEVFAAATSESAHVIALEQEISSNSVSAFVGWDYEAIGAQQGQYIVEQLGLARGSVEPFNIELFAGPVDDNNTSLMFDGAMNELNQFIADGELKVLSGQTTFKQAAIPNWSTEEAEERMKNLVIKNVYFPGGTPLHAVLASNDSIALGVSALLKEGWTSENFPIITGMDCDIANVKNIIAGTQSMSVFKDPKSLAAKAVECAMKLADGQKLETNKEIVIDGITIPAFLLEGTVVTKENYREVLIDSGYYTNSDLRVANR